VRQSPNAGSAPIKGVWEACSCVKFMGVFLDTKLSWKQQAENAARLL